MKLEAGKVFSIEKENQALKGCTVSKEIEGGQNPIIVFSMDKNTDISPEIFSEHKLLFLHEMSRWVCVQKMVRCIQKLT